jgi:hypothetical protein
MIFKKRENLLNHLTTLINISKEKIVGAANQKGANQKGGGDKAFKNQIQAIVLYLENSKNKDKKDQVIFNLKKLKKFL